MHRAAIVHYHTYIHTHIHTHTHTHTHTNEPHARTRSAPRDCFADARGCSELLPQTGGCGRNCGQARRASVSPPPHCVFVGSECSCHVHLCPLHSAFANLTINMQLGFYRRLACRYFPPSPSASCRNGFCTFGRDVDTFLIVKRNAKGKNSFGDAGVYVERSWQLCGRSLTDIDAKGWQQCQGSVAHTRGYPCGLWLVSCVCCIVVFSLFLLLFVVCCCLLFLLFLLFVCRYHWLPVRPLARKYCELVPLFVSRGVRVLTQKDCSSVKAVWRTSFPHDALRFVNAFVHLHHHSCCTHWRRSFRSQASTAAEETWATVSSSTHRCGHAQDPGKLLKKKKFVSICTRLLSCPCMRSTVLAVTLS
jgi:hypothetical protein